jgi:ABC-type transport system involved in cytochrome c biogenesis permease subunit
MTGNESGSQGGEEKQESDLDLTNESPSKSETVLDLAERPYLVTPDREDKSRSNAPERVATKTKTIEEEQEKIRGRLAQLLTGGAVILVFFFAVAAAAEWLSPDQIETLAAVILSPIIALAGSATGFYFGQKT